LVFAHNLAITSTRVLVDSKSVGAVPAVECWFVRLQEATKMNLLSFLIAAAQLTCAAPIPKEKDPPFAVVSVSYTNADNKQQTTPFEKARAVPPLEEPPGKLRAVLGALAARNAIVISGTGAKGNPTVKAIKIVISRGQDGKEEAVSITPKYENEKWSATIEANTLPTNAMYRVQFDGDWAKGTAPDVELGIASNN
jgi:hypothetical protein